ncbi:hypothetical protein ElyMa_006273400 [Elysia marginata]|uniref:IGFBP N-terminal domain-containing protein n=1 Tax=Elysia marginata TaxID=1093978 RepID=A0AAV4HBX2_9GAST|nr:hypothetical protein ElyMa_006273400 [Elysia marginata]
MIKDTQLAAIFTLLLLFLLSNNDATTIDQSSAGGPNHHPMLTACLNMIIEEDICSMCPQDSIPHCSQRMLDHCHCVTFCYVCQQSGSCPSNMCADEFCSVSGDRLCSPISY